MTRKRTPSRIVKEIFDPILSSPAEPVAEKAEPAVKEEEKPKEKNVFFQEREGIFILYPPKTASFPEKLKHRSPSLIPLLFFVTSLALLAAFLSYEINLFFELDSQTSSLKLLLHEKMRETRELEKRFEQIWKEDQAFKRSLELQDRERKSIVAHLRFLRKRFSEGRQGWSDLLLDLARLVPEKVWFQELLISSGGVVIHGYTLNRNSIRRFIKSLSESSRFENPRIVSYKGAAFPSLAYFIFEIRADAVR